MLDAIRTACEAMRVLLATRQGAVHASTAAINQLKALSIAAPDDLRTELRRLSRSQQVTRCASLRDRSALSTEHRMTIRALRSTAQRVRHLQAEARELRTSSSSSSTNRHQNPWSYSASVQSRPHPA
ncbi:hypothetical protein [Streptomyces dysideae]|uniref:Uncharacterized protein n=1 Tax=Streptomyces dysideae TaxID=909626 RepID=A0A101URV9_9ACTN|nr:hypothetical protein [Streptomyces dysideae]KUO15736.1 hypothetical protein AQJ91_39605 [Streptomyces dysideae]